MNLNVKELVQSCFGAVGLRLVKNKTDWDRFYSVLTARGYAPKHIIDIGANHGGWTRDTLKYFPNSYYTLIEPQDWLKADVQDLLARPDGKIRWIGAGVSDKQGTLPLTIAPRDDSSNFAVTSKQAQADGMRQIEVPITTLNEIVRTSTAPFPDIVKIDAEGFDLKVIAGASDLLGKTDLFFVEATLFANHLENTIESVVTTMSRAGYRVVDVTGINRSPKFGVAWLCDLAFLRKDSQILSDITSYE